MSASRPAAAPLPGDAAPRRVPRAAPPPVRPWTDRGGRFAPFKAAVFALLFVPALWLAGAWWLDALGARPVKALILGAGLFAARLLLLSLLLSPARILAAWPGVLPVRRMVGVAAALYAGAHLALYATEQGWHLGHVAGEILRRFYLTIGFVALLGLAALAATSTNDAMRRMGRAWKRLHRLAYPLAALALLHFFLQSKADVGEALLYAGVFAWAMLWRALPPGADRSLAAPPALALAACAVTAVLEYAWYALATHIPPARVLGAELALGFGPHPAGQVLVLGLVASLAVALRRLALREPRPATLDPVLYAGAALATLALVWCFALGGDAQPDSLPPWVAAFAWVGLGALLGTARARLHGTWQARAADAVWLLCLLYPLYTAGLDSRTLGLAGDAAIALAAAALAVASWPVSQPAGLLALPLVAWAGYVARLTAG
ncbi:MAG: sulfite oxidase heme-binding subunit YedZ [Janthinobacterium lividum]